MIKDMIRALIPQKYLNIYYSKKTSPKKVKKELSFEIHLVDHCNLNCMGCDNFSPLAEKTFLDINIFKRDLKRLSYLFNKKAGKILLLGGEPLLHPDIQDFFYVTRKYFPCADIKVLTNAITLLEKDKSFWQSCRDNNIFIASTRYPIKLDYEKIEEKIEEEQVKFEFVNNTGVTEKKMHIWKMDFKGKQNIECNFMLCHRANECISLKNGRMYTCTVVPNICHFNKFFNKNLEVSDEDYIDIFKAKSASEVLEFFIKPIPFCRYCDILHMQGGLEWKISKKDINEWS